MSEHFHQYRRGGYAGRGRKGDGATYTPALSSLPPERSLIEGLNPNPVKTLARPTPQEVSDKVVAVRNLNYIGSFNWTNATKPTVIIPGSLYPACSSCAFTNYLTPTQGAPGYGATGRSHTVCGPTLASDSSTRRAIVCRSIHSTLYCTPSRSCRRKPGIPSIGAR